MTKAENREIKNIMNYHAAGMTDTAARALSALIRATMRRTTAHELHRFAIEHQLHIHPDFII